MKTVIRKTLSRIWILVLALAMLMPEGTPAQEISARAGLMRTGALCSAGGAEESGNGSGIVLARKKKKKKKKNQDNSARSGSGTSGQEQSGSGQDASSGQSGKGGNQNSQKTDDQNKSAQGRSGKETEGQTEEQTVTEDGTYTSKEEVALYIHLYGHLPDNYITKQEAEDLGWDNREGNLDEVAPGKSIGGNRFGNYEGLLPEKNGRKYWECDIDFDGGYRGSRRIIYSNDGLVYYTEDHYKTFEKLY